MNHNGTEFFDYYLGLGFLGDGGENEVSSIYGGYNCITTDMDLHYFGGESPHYSVDRLGSEYAELLFSCDADYGRMFLYETDNYKAVSSSVVIGAVANGDSLNLKPYLIGEMVNHFMEYNPPTTVNENLSNPITGRNFPNPFTGNTSISYSVQKTGVVQINVYNSCGKMVKHLVDRDLTPGNYQIEWDATNDQGACVKSGFYFFELRIDDFATTEKMIFVK